MDFDHTSDSISPNPSSTSATITVNSTGSIAIPSGTTAERPSLPVNGMFRYNTDISLFEVYQNGSWETASVGNAGGLLGIGEYRYQTTTTPPPSTARFRFNNATPASATKFYIDYTNQEGTDLTNIWQAMTPASVIYVQERTNANNGFLIRVSSTINQSTYLEVDIGLISVFGTLTTNAKFNIIISYGNASLGQFFNPAVRCVTTGDINLASPGASIDGISLSVGDRVLVWQQTTPSENGIYVWNGATSAMTRPADADSWEEARGRRVYAIEGTIYANSTWENDSSYTGSIGVTSMTWTGSLRRISPGGRFDLGDSWTPSRANNAFGPRTLSLIDTTAVIRIWRFTNTAANPGLELIWGTNDDPDNSANAWWDVTLNEPPNEGIRIGKRGSATTGDLDAKLFASITGVRIGPDVAETNPAVALSIDATDAVLVPVGTTGERPTGANGYVRYNTTTSKFEGYENGAWRDLTTNFGTYFQNAASEGSSTTTSTTFQQKVTMTTPSLPSGDYRIGWYFEWQHTDTSTDFRARVRLNNTTNLMEQQEEPQDGGTDQWRPTSGYMVQTLSGANTIDLDYSRVGGSGTAGIRRARLEIWRVS